ncbi:MAG TPA: orotate phosphoribosyltransferase [Bacteroidia bacterium]|nr:orotate phosphoribosyltransferase [Bacteroidia bacterium]HNS13030.1 orotate phosphoribosyltransferase [Bacteroidia bacterium]
MIVTSNTASQIAEYLLQIKAIKLQPEKPFTWASGWKSPIYCDNRISLSYPEIRKYISSALTDSIQQNFPSAEVIAGVATAAIPQGALVANNMELPFIYVRSGAKGHGRENLIEGDVKKGQKVVVIEDLVSTGKSSLKAVQDLREAGCEVLGLICIFNYGFEQAENNFADANCPIISLCNYEHLLKHALYTDFIKKEDLKTLESWRRSPENWGR